MKNPFEIMKQVEQAYFLKAGSICSARRGKALSEARHVAIYLCRTHTKFSLNELAEIFQIDHTSIKYALARVRNTKDVDILEVITKNV